MRMINYALATDYAHTHLTCTHARIHTHTRAHAHTQTLVRECARGISVLAVFLQSAQA